MSAFELNALSPLDGRYASKLAPLRPVLSEAAFMRHRVQVEIAWLLALSEAGLPELPAFAPESRARLEAVVAEFSDADAARIKAIEQVTNHDVKAVEYFLKERTGDDPALVRAAEFIHFACTSEDINNVSHALMLTRARDDALLPMLARVIDALRSLAHAHADVPMLSRTHGQPASPTTLGKEMANFVARLERARERIGAVRPLAKMNGAVGNFNAHLAAYPDVDLQRIAWLVTESLGLDWY